MVAHKETSQPHPVSTNHGTENAALVIATVAPPRVTTTIDKGTLVIIDAPPTLISSGEQDAESRLISTTLEHLPTRSLSLSTHPHATSVSNPDSGGGKAVASEIVISGSQDWLPITAKDESMIPARWKYEPYAQEAGKHMAALVLMGCVIGGGILVVWGCGLVRSWWNNGCCYSKYRMKKRRRRRLRLLDERVDKNEMIQRIIEAEDEC
ncbi:hypothetical protein K491DRAFT_247840 [Lophiostoma macrostomum CBS 122681]|uniref:Uncharacterized protein n=1 Tax=Lophiostoma macrostomum CBS 122681 TaxID=1314788 RepID=A0A6A6THZ4_9PLEO|nr:hypothetical protein K491DRAFT_247840 [Lophiostoma macrostomum CBS 122681]